MGEVLSTNVLGPKSIKNHKPKDVNYLDPKNARNVKNELYQLYTHEKLIHIEKYNELESQMNKLLDVTKQYNKQIREYKDTVESLKDKIRKLEDKLETNSYISDRKKKEDSMSDKKEYMKEKDSESDKEDLDTILSKK